MSEPAPPSSPMDTGASSGAPDSRTAPPPTPLPPPTLAPRRTPTPTPTPPPLQPIPHAAPDAPPPKQSPARRQAPCPLLWCLLIGASALACLPTDMWHQAQATRKAPARHAGPASSSAMIALLMILGAGATPRAMSAPVSAHAAALNLTTPCLPDPSRAPGTNRTTCGLHPCASTAAAATPARRPDASRLERRSATGTLVARQCGRHRRPPARAAMPHVRG